MNNAQKFINYLEEEVKNRSIYVWGGQGQKLNETSDAKIRAMETGTANANRAIAKKNKVIAEGYGGKARIFDCSGLGVYYLQKLGLLSYDTTANGLRGLCTAISKRGLAPGDFVFRVSGGNAYHIGYVVDGLYVIEAKGRDDGVIKSKSLSGSYWNAFGRPEKIFGKEVPAEPRPEPAQPVTVLKRVLKVTSPYMRGDDVQQAQAFLISAKCSCGSTGADGVFGGGTEAAVKAYQKEKKLAVDGKIGKKTWEAFGGTWGV